MQTNSLPIQLNTTATNPAQRNGAAGNADSAQGGVSFGAMLSNEMEARQTTPASASASAPAPAPAAPKAEAPKPQAADKPAQPDDAAPQQAAKPEEGNKPAAADKADAKDADSEDGSAGDQPAQAADPASAMLALMASLQQPVQDTKTDATGGAAAQAFDALSGAAGKGKRGDAAQLAALQAAMKSVGKDAGAGKAFSDAAPVRNPALAALGAALGTDDKRVADAGDKLGADLRAALSATAGKTTAEPQLDAADLAVQQAREAAAAREPVAAAALAQVQPAAMEAAQLAAAAADELSARVGTDAWENQVGQKVVYMVGNEEQTASLTLNPPDLGPLQVVLSVTNDGASVTFSANQEEVRQALEDALPRLREMMSESGIALGNASVNAGMPDNRQAQEQAARSNGGFGGNGRGRGDAGGNAVDEVAARPVTRTVALGDRGMVDTFA